MLGQTDSRVVACCVVVAVMAVKVFPLTRHKVKVSAREGSECQARAVGKRQARAVGERQASVSAHHQSSRIEFSIGEVRGFFVGGSCFLCLAL